MMKEHLLMGIFSCLLCLSSPQLAMAQQKASRFPLKLSADKRHLIGSDGHFFLYQADTGWLLLLNLTKSEALEYLQTRKEQGFDAIQVMLTGFINEKAEPPHNREGQTPFLNGFDFTQPNEAYFDHVAWVVRQADSLGLLISMAPLWAGCCGEGWAGENKAMEKNGLQKSHQFGEYLGKRFGQFNNVVWILGGDNDPHADREAMRQLAMGIRQAAPGQLITYHAASTHSSTDVWPDEPWLDVVMIYTYFRGFNKAWNKIQPDVYEAAYAEYQKQPARPFFLGESTYEGEHGGWGSALQVRKQAWWAVLGGGTGHAYGSPAWRCDSAWRTYLKLPGANSLHHLTTLFSRLPWQKLVPDTTNRVAVAGRGKFASNKYTVTAVADDGSFSVSYLPTQRSLSIDLNQLTGNTFRVHWYNPRTGARKEAGRYPNPQLIAFTPPGVGDWVLIIANEKIHF